MPDGDLTGQVLLTRAWLFQLVAAVPIFLALGWWVFDSFFWSWSSIYTLCSALFNCLFAGGIVFIILVQRQLPGASKSLTSYFEIGKSVLATAMWIWLLCDAVYHPRHYSYYPPDVEKEYQKRKIVFSVIALVIPIVIFYPTAIYTTYLARKAGELPGSARVADGGSERGEGSNEQTPLLGA
ncbi:hypothetical protein B0T26DRAFT_473238 [Lasiosphaeria miniovina]|uniref:Uncharacterized protein n=1 Tax=Lasiosphaeria miniovina TaxID=1954250 RepID=A0AA40A052_9PEZI|nr:uncharacterized protein B0T26DRAFT_473238 [Lasiosphaeria miniovina]KAK0706799.1 hypothetical protein B0T26DRAFT_473238 [Lasiosphaeria miniovina]